MLVWAYLLKRNEKKKKESSEYIYIYIAKELKSVI
jgi:hypothetical protein